MQTTLFPERQIKNECAHDSGTTPSLPRKTDVHAFCKTIIALDTLNSLEDSWPIKGHVDNTITIKGAFDDNFDPIPELLRGTMHTLLKDSQAVIQFMWVFYFLNI